MSTLSKIYELCEFSCAVSIRGILNERGNHLARSGIQSEHRIHFILPAGAASYMIKWLTELDIYWPIISYPISRSQVSTCGFFPRKRQIELLSYSIQHMMVSWWSNEPFFFFPLAPLDRFISSRTEISGKNIYHSQSQVFISFFVFISSPCREGRKWIDK